MGITWVFLFEALMNLGVSTHGTATASRIEYLLFLSMFDVLMNVGISDRGDDMALMVNPLIILCV